MKIEVIELRHVRMRLREPFETSFGVELDRDCLILRVDCEGMTGWGECVAGITPGYSYETTKTAWHILSEFYIPTVLGREVADVEDYHRGLGAFKGHNLARAGLEMALWDLIGKVQGKSLTTTLGGVVERVPVGVSIGIQQDPSALVDTVGRYVEAGYRRVKIKIKPGRDVVEVEAVRKSFPDLPSKSMRTPLTRWKMLRYSRSWTTNSFCLSSNHLRRMISSTIVDFRRVYKRRSVSTRASSQPVTPARLWRLTPAG